MTEAILRNKEVLWWELVLMGFEEKENEI